MSTVEMWMLVGAGVFAAVLFTLIIRNRARRDPELESDGKMKLFGKALNDLMEERRPKETAELKRTGKFDELLNNVQMDFSYQTHSAAMNQNDINVPFQQRMNNIYQAKAVMERQLLDELNAMVAWEDEAWQEACERESEENDGDDFWRRMMEIDNASHWSADEDEEDDEDERNQVGKL